MGQGKDYKMSRRQQLINMVNDTQGHGNWWGENCKIYSTRSNPSGGHDPTYCEYQNLRHRLGLIGDEEARADKIHYHKQGDGTWANDTGELAEKNRAAWRAWIEQHKNDGLLP